MKEIPLTKGKVAIVDDEDYERLSQFKWHCLKTGNKFYAVRKTRETAKFRGTVLMHRDVMNPPKEFQVDHIDQNGLNNTRSNLRLATAQENRRNRSKTRVNKTGYKGVLVNFSCSSYESWVSRIALGNGKYEHLGRFRSPEEAAKAYDEAATKYFGEFASLNFPASQGLC